MSAEDERHIFACGGLLPRPGVPPIVTAMLAMTRKSAPRLCLLPTGDESDLDLVDAMQRALDGSPVEVSCLRLFPMPNVADPADVIGSSDAVFVNGGSTANMVAVWRVHGLDTALRDAWHAGVVVGGTSAGAMCWFEGGLTHSFGPQLEAWSDGLGLLGGSFCPHYDQASRRARYLAEVGAGALPSGLACSDGATAHFVGTELSEIVAETDDVEACRVERCSSGEPIERPIALRRIDS